ncbi:Putative HTH CenpB-type DNA-binding domain, DNA binding HTH domain, Psq-type [Septoria linicola]|uniref:HTH CenpB-type DNA-binding domain, DNA binding HTH domain, Psq-type n=1 Tax=Septoria linicola TaxID=215465 RepID=A0A9Q9ADZ4_9PEZI|nr:putative HTH CenpB-type DNA-binding domain, DNA binding HTH domain, Psq-type [Septoria linicola]USW47212.1 Putative HTH CenpB-type DNA-binding domain, DNA binding HTH domain, Psq-type [Septoria linicola]
MANDDRNTAYRSSPQTHWNHFPTHPHSHHGTPAQEYHGFNFTSPQLSMEPSAFASSVHQRPMHHHLQPLVTGMPQWPSMLNSQAHPSYQPVYTQPVQPLHPMSAGPLMTPVSAISTRSTSTPRKTLTDLDRKRMCQYAEEHPNSKQTEIGAIFGVERSTVSKVLRQKEKYLFQEDGSRSPVKRAKGRSPDIERALAVWAKNQEKKGNPLSDDLIRAQARAFAATTTTPDNHVALSSSWIEKFKLKNNLMGARSRKASLAPEDPDHPAAASSSSHTPGDMSPVSPLGLNSPSPIDLHSVQSRESLKHESPDDYLDFAGGRHGPFHTQSTASLHSAYTDTAPSSFSPGPLSPTTSPFFTPDSGTAPSPFVPMQHPRSVLVAPSSTNSHRPRSQTFPRLDQYAMNAGEAETSKYSNSSALDSPMEEPPDPLVSLDEAMGLHGPESRAPTVTPSETMRPPPLPAHIDAARRESLSQLGIAQGTTPEEARQALQVVLSFFEQQPGGLLSFSESVTIGKLMEKLKLQSQGGSS